MCVCVCAWSACASARKRASSKQNPTRAQTEHRENTTHTTACCHAAVDAETFVEKTGEEIWGKVLPYAITSAGVVLAGVLTFLLTPIQSMFAAWADRTLSPRWSRFAKKRLWYLTFRKNVYVSHYRHGDASPQAHKDIDAFLTKLQARQRAVACLVPRMHAARRGWRCC